MFKRANAGSDPSIRKNRPLPERPEDLLRFWSENNRRRAVATCYTELWQMKHKNVADAILQYVEIHPDCACEDVAQAFPDVYEAVIVALVLGPVTLGSQLRSAAVVPETPVAKDSVESDDTPASVPVLKDAIPW